MPENKEMPLVSAIIPTHRRPHLVTRAIDSVLRQTYPRVEVIVVIDGMDTETRSVVEALNEPSVICIETGRKAGPAEARNIGVQRANGKFVALLDDDDEWTLDKVAVQIQLATDRGLLDQDFILSSRTECRSSDGVSIICPDSLYQSGDLGEYLFDRPTPTGRPGLVPTGTMLMPRSLVLRVPFATHDAHEEMGWLLSCVSSHHVPLVMSEEVLFIHHLMVGTRAQSQSWQASLAFARAYRPYMSGRAFSGLLSSTTAWRAKRQDGFRAILTIGRAMSHEGASRLAHWLSLAGIALLPLEPLDRWRRRR